MRTSVNPKGAVCTQPGSKRQRRQAAQLIEMLESRVFLSGTSASAVSANAPLVQAAAVSVANTVSMTQLSANAYGAGDTNSCSVDTNNLITDTASNLQFAAFYDVSGNIIIGRRSVGSTNWKTFSSGISIATGDLTDDHNVISIAVDSAGFMHMSWDMHNVALKYAISNAVVTGSSLSSISFTIQTSANAPTLFADSGSTTNEVTYPQFYKIPSSSNLLFVYRNGGAGGGSGNGNEYFDIYNPSTKTWSNELVINGIQTSVNGYVNRLTYDSHNNLLMSWTWRATPNWQTNSNLMFAQSPDNGQTWYQQGGTTQYTLPIIQSGTPAASVAQVVEAIPQNSSYINQTSMTVDANDNPLIATYLAPNYDPATGTGNVNRQYVLYYYSGGQWKSTQVSQRTTDTSVDTSGADVRDLGRPIVLVDKQNRVLIVTRSDDTSMGAYSSTSTPNNDIVVYYCSNLSSSNPTWNSITLDSANMGSYEPSYDSILWNSQNKLSMLYEPMGLSGETTGTVSTLDWDEQTYFTQLAASHSFNGSSFESPSIATYQYSPSGGGWSFRGNAGIEHNGSAFNAATAPDGVQAAFLQSNVTAGQKAIGSISQSIDLAAGTYSVSFQAAQRSGKTVLPIAVSIDGTQIGSAITATSTSWAGYTTVQFTVTTAGTHTISFTGVDTSTVDKDVFIDAVSVNASNQAPTIATAAAATPSPVSGKTTNLSVLGADDGGESNLTYTWSLTGTPPASVSYSANNSNAAKNAVATFSKAGSYSFLVTVTDTGGLSITSAVNVTVVSTLSAITVSPSTTPSVAAGQTQQFTASGIDQFGTTVIVSPTWTATGGTISSAGLYTASSTAGTFAITATSGSVSGQANVAVTSTSTQSIFTGQADIGSVGLAGSSSTANNVYSVTGAGSDVWGTSDNFHYVYVPFSGDGQIIARVTAIQNTNASAKAGVMFRESLAANSRNAFVGLYPTKGIFFQTRTATGGSTARSTKTGTAPYWVKLVRSGSTFQAFYSADGSTWTQVGKNITIAMANTIYIGLAVTSHTKTVLNTSTFANVSVTPYKNLALSATATATSTAASSSATNAIDGNSSSLWTSSAAGSQSLTVDLGSTKSVSHVQINWASNYAKSYTVQSSTNASTWTTLYTTTAGAGGVVDVSGLLSAARYFRISLTAANSTSYGLYELLLLGQ